MKLTMQKEAFMRRTVPILAALWLVVAAPQVIPQETESVIPELEAFHEIIYPIWHSAYPEKDIAALKGFVPEIDRLAGKIYGAVLPGILRDKEAKWQAGLAELRKSVEAYAGAAKGTDDQALLDAAETLHARYEMLVRTVRPVLKEMDEFHKVLYVVFHKSLPDKMFGEIRAVSPDLKAKAEAVAKAKLSQRMEARNDRFQAAAADLVTAATSLAAASGGADDAAVEKAVLALHEKYVALEKIFD
jgi:hypothetical protein